MQEEIDSLICNDTWILTQLSMSRTAIDGKWVYKIKRAPKERFYGIKPAE